VGNASSASASHKRTAVLSPAPPPSMKDGNEVDSDFDPNFIHNILQDQGVIPSDVADNMESSMSLIDEPELPSESSDSGDSIDNNSVTNHDHRLPHSPVIYRYYGKSRSRTRASGSIPFILLGPDIDHWRTTGENLAARGFSVIACERDSLEHEEEEEEGEDDDDDEIAKKQQKDKSFRDWQEEDEWWKGTDGEGANLILNVLQASRWSKAILVACDSEAVVAIQAALKLAPEKIAGVVFCGNLMQVDSLLEKSHPHLIQEGDFAIDTFLRNILPCPFAIAWDGETLYDMPPLSAPSEFDSSSPAECLNGNRCLILGGGIAPHRRQPETFSWALTRFVEDKVAPSIPITNERRLLKQVKNVRRDLAGGEGRLSAMLAKIKHTFSSSFLSGDYFSPESFVVYGRVVASALLYASMLKVGIFQYSNFLDKMVKAQSFLDGVVTIRRRILGTVAGFFLNYGYIPLLFQKSEVKAVEYDDQEWLNNEVEEMPPEEEVNPKKDEEEEHAESSRADPQDLESEENDQEQESAGSEEEEESKEELRYFQPLFFLDRVVA